MKNIKNRLLPKELLCLMFFIAFSNCKENKCEYTPCSDECKLFEDFESYSINSQANWQAISGTVSIQTNNNSKALFANDGSGASYIYNLIDFPQKLVDEGCELSYDVQYLAGNNNNVTASNSIIIFQGVTPITTTASASFVLNNSSLISSGNPPKTIKVPLQAAFGTSLPSNSLGQWVLSGASNPLSSSDISKFNNLIQNISGVAFFIDNGSNPIENWWFDNFCLKKCCP